MRQLLDRTRSTAIYVLPVSPPTGDPELANLREILESAAQMLPNDGPVSAFTFLNTLHAFEYLPFDHAIREGARLFGCQPYWPEDRYRAEMARRRIRPIDLQAALDEDLREKGQEEIAGLCTRRTLRAALMQHRIEQVADAELAWCMVQSSALTQFAIQAPAGHRQAILEDVRRRTGPGGGVVLQHGSEEEWAAVALQKLWSICQTGTKTVIGRFRQRLDPIRPRNVLLMRPASIRTTSSTKP